MNPDDPKPSPAPARPGLIRRTLRRWGRPILVLWLVGSVALIATAYLTIRPSYRAASFLRVDPKAANLYGIPTSGDQLAPFLQTQVQLITSPNVLTAAGTNPKAAVLPRIKAAGDVVIELRKLISVSIVPETYLIEVEMTSPSPYEAATLVNAVVDAFIDANGEWSDGMTRTQVKNLETYLGDLKNQSEELEGRWRELVARGNNDVQVRVKEKLADGTTRTEVQGARRSSITIDEYKRLRSALFEADLELISAEAKASSQKTAMMTAGKNPESKADEERVDMLARRLLRQEPEMVDLSSRIAGAKERLEEGRQAAKSPDDPAVRSAQVRLDLLSAQLDRLTGERLRTLRAEILAEKDPERELREAEGRVRALRSQKQALREEFEKLEIENRKQASDEVDIALVMDQWQSLKSMMGTVNLRLEQLKFEAKGEARVRPVNVAVPPGRPISDHRIKAMTAAPLAMLPLAFAFFACVEAFAGARPVPGKSAPQAEV